MIWGSSQRITSKRSKQTRKLLISFFQDVNPCRDLLQCLEESWCIHHLIRLSTQHNRKIGFWICLQIYKHTRLQERLHWRSEIRNRKNYSGVFSLVNAAQIVRGRMFQQAPFKTDIVNDLKSQKSYVPPTILSLVQIMRQDVIDGSLQR